MDVVMPQLGETVKEGTVTVWRKKVGERVEANEPLFEVNTDKVETEIPAPVSGVVSAILVAEWSTVQVGVALAVIEEEGKPHARAAPASAPPNPVAATPEARRPPRPATAPAHEGGPPLSPVVRRLLAEHEVDASAIAGSGAGGRITRDDVLAYVEGRKGSLSPQAVERVPLNRIRKRTAEQMALSWRTIPHVLQAVEVDFQSVDRARLARAESWKAEEGWALTYLPFVAFAVCRAIPDFPAVNASFDGDALVLHRRINLGIAVDLGGEGLIVPVVKDAAGAGRPGYVPCDPRSEKRTAALGAASEIGGPVPPFEGLLDLPQERRRVGAVEGAVVERLGQDADRMDGDAVAVRDGLVRHCVGGKDGHLRRIDDRRREQGAEASRVRQRVGRFRHVVRREAARPRFLRY